MGSQLRCPRATARTRRESEPRDAGSVTASEFTFLALGIGLGVVSGIALAEILRTRPPAQRQVRLTIETDAIPRRRPSTLSDDAFTAAVAEPARGGPADRRLETLPVPSMGFERRTTVRSHPGVPVFATTEHLTRQPAGRLLGSAFTVVDPGGSTGPRGALVAIPVAGGDDPVLAALRSSSVSSTMRSGSAVIEERPMPTPEPSTDRRPEPIAMLTAVAVLERPVAESGPSEPSGPGGRRRE